MSDTAGEASRAQKAPETTGTNVRVSPLPFQIAIPDLRNGALVSIQQASPRASMSALYHWPVITGLTHADAVAAVEYVIRACYAQALQSLAGTTVVTAEWRAKAIVVGAVRVGAAAAFKLTAADLSPSELVPAGMSFEGGRIGQSANGSTASARWTQAQSMDALTDTEWNVVASCIYMGMAIAPLQGVSLVMTGHHYIPPTYNIFAGLKRQAMGTASKPVTEWVSAMGENFDDMAFHKALHPVNPIFKRSLAKDNDVKMRLAASGHGSASIRLPAIPSEASGAKAVVALIQSASATAKIHGHVFTADTLVGLLVSLQHAADALAEADVSDKIVSWIATNSAGIALCAGIVSHVHEVSGTGTNTILRAYSVKRIMSDNPQSVSSGVVYARSALTKQRDAMAGGTFEDPAIAM